MRSLPRDLSGGEKQRVAIARSLANGPRLILADEPTANLDAKTGQDVTLLLCETACRENRAVIIVSHDQRLITAAKRVITIEDGRLPAEIHGEHDLHCRMHAGAAPR
jgi:putative ABC transport system ATP-binding protein